MRFFVSVILSIALASGCTSWKTLEDPNPRNAIAALHVNDTVQIVTHDGGQYQFQVAAIQEDAVIGNGNERIPIDDIHIIDVKRFDAVETGALVLGPPLLIGALFVISLASLTVAF
jgi:hypothetical protein